MKPLNILISEYAEGVLGDDALFMKAQILEEHLNSASEAQQVYQQFLVDFPGSVTFLSVVQVRDFHVM